MNPLDSSSSSSAFNVETPPIQTALKNPKPIKNYTRELKIFCECAYDSKGTISSSDRSYCLCDWLCHALKTCFKVIYYWIFSFKRDPQKIEENQVNINTYKKQLMDTLELIMTKDSKEFEDKTTFHAYQWVLNANLAKVQQLLDTSSGFNSTLKQENQLKLLKHGYEKAIQLFNDKHLQQQPEFPGRVDISSNEISPPTLKNIGNSCYMDSALQLLWLMRDELYVKIKLILTQSFNKNSEEFESYLKKISVAKALDVFYQACYSGQSDRIQDSLYKFRNLIFIGCLHPEFTPGHEHRQMDSYAFISLVLEALNGDEMLPSYEFKTADNHPLPVIKDGEKRYLKLNLGQNPNDPRTLQDLINENHTKEAFHWRIAENIDGINAQKEDKLILQGDKVAPEYLFLQILRTGWDPERGIPNKLNTPVYFPNNQQVTIPFYRSEDEAMTVLNPEPMPYEIIGVQNHYGSSIHSGHYTAHVKDTCTQQWVHCNDIGGNSTTKPNFKIDAKHSYFVLLKKVR